MRLYLKRALSLFFIFYITFSSVPFLGQTEVYAHDAMMIEPLINISGGGYSISAREDTHGAFGENHSEGNIIALNNYFMKKDNSNSSPFGAGFGSSELSVSSMFSNFVSGAPSESWKPAQKDNMGEPFMLLFPAKSEGGFLMFGAKGADGWDKQRASTIASTLSPTLNRLIKTALAGNGDTEAEERAKSIIAASLLIMPQVTSGEYNIVEFSSGTTGSTKNYAIIYFNELKSGPSGPYDGNEKSLTPADAAKHLRATPQSDGNLSSATSEAGSLYAYLFELDGDRKIPAESLKSAFNGGMIWAMPKGYVGEAQKVVIREGASEYGFASNDEDVVYITIHMLTLYANTAYAYNGYSLSAAPEQRLGFVEAAVSGIFNGLIDGIKGALGLYGMDELIFNKGIRGTDIYTSGLMPQQWWSVVLKYFTIFQIIAWMAIGLAIVKTLIQVNFGIVSSNSSQRARLMDMMLKMFTVGMLLVLCIPIMRLMVVVNNTLVDVFATAYTGDMGAVPQATNVFAQILLGFYYLMIFLFVNFTYIMRGITLAVLMAMGPFFIVSMAFFSKGKGLFDNWIKEVSANIFIQSFHAFCFSFLFEAIAFGGNGIENAVIVFSIIPLTNFFRQMIFGEAGGFAVKMGGQLGNMATSVLKNAASGTAKLGAGAVGSAVAKRGVEASGAGASATGGRNAAGGGTLDRSTAQSVGETLKGASKNAQSQAEGAARAESGGAKGGSSKLAAALGGLSTLSKTGGGAAEGLMDMMQGMAFDDAGLRASGAEKAGGAVAESLGAAGSMASSVAKTGAKAAQFTAQNGVKGVASAAGQGLKNAGASTGRAFVGAAKGAQSAVRAVKSGEAKGHIASAAKKAGSAIWNGGGSHALNQQRDKTSLDASGNQTTIGHSNDVIRPGGNAVELTQTADRVAFMGDSQSKDVGKDATMKWEGDGAGRKLVLERKPREDGRESPPIASRRSDGRVQFNVGLNTRGLGKQQSQTSRAASAPASGNIPANEPRSSRKSSSSKNSNSSLDA